ncbi:hypothetical protein C9374_007615 [Naegleria lovaniensis]|uniref:TATA-box-binding protein n=1 Tax=Naegleria lovaniensis TaxID=51637 RepID=A0AA88GKC4_NAELO|nr:uncharacterized protein C9374_007615 [Naegleria lovaniensis]KAG2378977.1 hypothetical protein C9374_007615 [Naegleria lovaniensis]
MSAGDNEYDDLLNNLSNPMNFMQGGNFGMGLPTSSSASTPMPFTPTPQTPMVSTPMIHTPVHTPLHTPLPTSSFVPPFTMGMNPPPTTPYTANLPTVASTPLPSGVVVPTTTPTTANEYEHGIVPIIQNVVSTVNLGCELKLKQIALHARNAEYNPKRFAAVIMRIRDPKTTALIFASGKMVVTGAKSEDESRLAARKYARIIQKLGFNAKFTEFKIQNIVGSCDVGFPIRLEGLNCQHHNYASYEPEIFPGLIYRMVDPKVVLLIFVSGKIVLTGAKHREIIYQAFNNIYPVLKDFKKDDNIQPKATSDEQ